MNAKTNQTTKITFQNENSQKNSSIGRGLNDNKDIVDIVKDDHDGDGDDNDDALDHFQIDNFLHDDGDDPMKGLISNLFRALHAENDKEVIQPLESNNEKI